MTGWVTGTEVLQGTTKDEAHYWPPPEWVRVWVTLNDILEDEVVDIEFQITHEGLIINVKNIHDEIVYTSGQTFEEIIADLEDMG